MVSQHEPRKRILASANSEISGAAFSMHAAQNPLLRHHGDDKQAALDQEGVTGLQKEPRIAAT